MPVAVEVLRKHVIIFNHAGFPVDTKNVDIARITRDAARSLMAGHYRDPSISFIPPFIQDCCYAAEEEEEREGEGEETLKRKRTGSSSNHRSDKRKSMGLSSMVDMSLLTIKEWKEGLPKTESISMWEWIPNVPERKFQSSNYRSTRKRKESKITREEKNIESNTSSGITCGISSQKQTRASMWKSFNLK